MFNKIPKLQKLDRNVAKPPHVKPSTSTPTLDQSVDKARTDLVERIRVELKSQEPDTLTSKCYYALLAMAAFIEQTFDGIATLWTALDKLLRGDVTSLTKFKNLIKFDQANTDLVKTADEEEEARLRDWIASEKTPLLKMLNDKFSASQDGDQALVFGTLRTFVERSTDTKVAKHWIDCSREALETDVGFPRLCGLYMTPEMRQEDPLYYEAANQFLELEKDYLNGGFSPHTRELAIA